MVVLTNHIEYICNYSLTETIVLQLTNNKSAQYHDGHWPTAQFLPRDALVHSAVLRLHVVRLSVCL